MSNNIYITETELIITETNDVVNVTVIETQPTVITIGEVIQTNTQDHTELLNIGVYTHAQIDNHLSDTEIHIINNTIDGGLFQP